MQFSTPHSPYAANLVCRRFLIITTSSSPILGTIQDWSAKIKFVFAIVKRSTIKWNKVVTVFSTEYQLGTPSSPNCWFLRRGEKLSEQRELTTNSTHISRQIRESYPGHTGGNTGNCSLYCPTPTSLIQDLWQGLLVWESTQTRMEEKTTEFTRTHSFQWV